MPHPLAPRLLPTKFTVRVQRYFRVMLETQRNGRELAFVFALVAPPANKIRFPRDARVHNVDGLAAEKIAGIFRHAESMSVTPRFVKVSGRGI